MLGNHCRDDGAAQLAEAIDRNSTLTSLDLAGNSLGTDGIKALCNSLKSTKTIVEINLGGNSIGNLLGTYRVIYFGV